MRNEGKIIKHLNETRVPQVGIFFKIKDAIWGDSESVRDVESYNGIYDLDRLHMDYFDELTYIPELEITMEDDYAWYPRGRVIYDSNNDQYNVIMDKCLDNDEDKRKIIDDFNLPKDKVVWKDDYHYCCKDCSDEIRRQYDRAHRNRR